MLLTSVWIYLKIVIEILDALSFYIKQNLGSRLRDSGSTVDIAETKKIRSKKVLRDSVKCKIIVTNESMNI